MTKGRVAWVFWLLVVLALLTSTASYAWLSMSFSAGTKGIAVSLRSDSEYLQISANYSDGYMEEISCGKDDYVFDDGTANEIFLVTYGYLPEQGGLKINSTLITEQTADSLGFEGGLYSGVGRLYRSSKSDIHPDAYGYEEVTSLISEGESVLGLYVIDDSGDFDVASEDKDTFYYYRHTRIGGFTDYVCVGSFPVGDNLAGRRYWGYAVSDDILDSQEGRMLNIVSIDVPKKEYAYKKTVHLRTARGSDNVTGLCVNTVRVKGLKNYLTDAMNIMFVAKSDKSEEEAVLFYDNSKSSSADFNGELFEMVLGNAAETITVDVYIFFDGTNEKAFTENGVLSNHSINISFSIDERQN